MGGAFDSSNLKIGFELSVTPAAAADHGAPPLKNQPSFDIILAPTGRGVVWLGPAGHGKARLGTVRYGAVRHGRGAITPLIFLV